MGDGGTSDRGGGGELRLVHRAWCFGWIFLNFFSRLFSSVLLRAGGSVKDLAAWSSPPPLKSLCCAHSCTVHITSPAPSSSPTHPPTANDSRARPLHEATAFSTSCTYTHMHTNLAHAHARAREKHRAHAQTSGHNISLFPLLGSFPFIFSHIAQFLPLLLTLRKIP